MKGGYCSTEVILLEPAVYDRRLFVDSTKDRRHRTPLQYTYSGSAKISPATNTSSTNSTVRRLIEDGLARVLYIGRHEQRAQCNECGEEFGSTKALDDASSSCARESGWRFWDRTAPVKPIVRSIAGRVRLDSGRSCCLEPSSTAPETPCAASWESSHRRLPVSAPDGSGKPPMLWRAGGAERRGARGKSRVGSRFYGALPTGRMIRSRLSRANEAQAQPRLRRSASSADPAAR